MCGINSPWSNCIEVFSLSWISQVYVSFSIITKIPRECKRQLINKRKYQVCGSQKTITWPQSSKSSLVNNSSSETYLTINESPINKYFNKRKKIKECNWCKKLGHYYQGHVHSECRRLKDQKEKEKNERDEKTYQAHTVLRTNHIISAHLEDTSMKRL